MPLDYNAIWRYCKLQFSPQVMDETLGITPNLPRMLRHSDGRAKALDRHAHILRLPNELLHQCLLLVVGNHVLSFADYDSYWRYPSEETGLRRPDCRDRYRSALPLILTCRRFHSVGSELLYASVSLDISPGLFETQASRRRQEKRFLQTLQRNRGLQPLVHHVALDKISIWDSAVKACGSLPRLKSLSLFQSFGGQNDHLLDMQPVSASTVP